MSSNPFLLGIHVALALGLTILVGIQCALLSSLRHGDAKATPGGRGRSQLAALSAIPAVTLSVAVTGGMLLGAGARGGPWVLAGVVSAVVIAASAGWSIWLRSRSRAMSWQAPVRAIAAVQWGAPAFTVAAAFLMAWRPESALGASAPIVASLALTGAAARWAAVKPHAPAETS